MSLTHVIPEDAKDGVGGFAPVYFLVGAGREMDLSPASSPSASEQDPLGLHPHHPGAKLDAGKVRLGLVLLSFSRSLEAVGQVGTYGANKYSDLGWVEVPSGIARYTDALLRHLLAEGRGEANDPQTELLHAAHVAWNALARLDLMLRQDEPGQSTPSQATPSPSIPS